MPVRVACPNCGVAYGMDASHVGRQARCRKCGHTFSAAGTQFDSQPPAGGLPPVAEPAAGQVFAERYLIEAVLGAGGMGAVYRAVDRRLRRPVALKVPHFPGGGPKAVERMQKRFDREARVLAQFRHPNLCPVLDVGEFAGTRYITMPLLDGEPLSKLIKPDPAAESGVPMEQARAAEIARAIALAMAEAHSLGVIHRDLKPANVLMDRKVGPVVVDFGLARPEAPDDGTMTHADDVFGTPAYMAPEQHEGDHDAIGPAADVYALGVMLYEMLTGRVPYRGKTAGSIYVQIVAGKPPLAEHRPDVDQALAAIALRAMAKASGDRYASMEEMAGALAAWRDERAGRSTVPPGETDGPSSVEVPTWPKRRPWWLVAAVPVAAMLLVALGLVIKIATDRSSHQPAEPPQFTNSLGIKLVRIESGLFDMGSNEAQIEQIVKLYPELPASIYDKEKPQHRVEITKPFYLGEHEVTVGQFRRFVEATAYKTDVEKDGKGGGVANPETGGFEKDPNSNWRNPGYPQSDDHPVVQVSPNDAVAFCTWLTSRDTGVVYRLPTEAEWEYAARAGPGGLYPNGDDPDKLTEIGNVADATFQRAFPKELGVKGDDGYVYTAPVGSFAESRWGLHDMIGNVWEWCADGYDAKYYASSPAADPTGAAGASTHVSRGGCWGNDGSSCRSANRVGGDSPFPQINNPVGFRVAAVRSD